MTLAKNLALLAGIVLSPMMTDAQTRIVAHRGFSALAPENTLIAFQKAIECGADYFELDVQKTKDDSIVVIHDASVNRTSSNNMKGKIARMTYRELTAVKVGLPAKFGDQYENEKIPTLREALELARGKIKVCIEIKVHDAEKEVVKIVNELRMSDDVIIFSFYTPVLVKIRELDKNIHTLFLINAADKTTINHAKVIESNAIGVGSGTTLTKEFLNAAHQNGLEVWQWTVDDEARMKELIDLGIDGLITNYPDKALLKQHSVTKIRNSEKVLYEELTPVEFRERLKDAPIAYLPMGTLEWHGEHLPIGSDGIQSLEFFKLLAERAGGIVLPMLFLAPDTMLVKDGTEYYGSDFITAERPGKYYYPVQQLHGSAYYVDDNTFFLIMEGILKQMKRAGFKIVVAHGHGPSTVFLIRHWKEWEEKFGLIIYNCWCWNIRGKYDKECDEKAGEGYGIMVDHAAVNETSLMMALRPELVQMQQLSTDTADWPLGVNGKDPRVYASSELGWEAINMHLDRMSQLLKKDLEKLGYNKSH